MNTIKCNIEVKYNDDILYYGGGVWNLYNGVHLVELCKIVINGSLAYRIRGGKKFYYRSKMERFAKKCNVSLPNCLPF